MCAATAVNFAPFYLLFATLINTILHQSKMATVGLPIPMQELGQDRGIIAGADFLSLLLRTQDTHPQTSTTPDSLPTTILNDFLMNSVNMKTPSSKRVTRSTSYYSPLFVTRNENSFKYSPTRSSQFRRRKNVNLKQSSDSTSLSDEVVVAVSVSSSVGRTLINKETPQNEEVPNLLLSTEKSKKVESPSEDQNYVASEEHPSIIAEANKSDFSVEEKEPITSNNPDLAQAEFDRNFQSNLPREHAVPFHTQSYISQQINQNLKNSYPNQPFHQTVIYHTPKENGQARSVSYSTVIQAINNDKAWSNDKLPHDRQDRHYDINRNGNIGNNYKIGNEKSLANDSQLKHPEVEPQSFYTQQTQSSQNMPLKNQWEQPKPIYDTTTQSFYTQQTQSSQNIPLKNQWEQPKPIYDTTTTTTMQPASEKHWESSSESYGAVTTQKPWTDKSFSTTPNKQRIYTRPEQNYEIDESVSVVSNGRVHGVQVGQTSKPEEGLQKETNEQPASNKNKDADDNQKVGYVVEGRNYRRYRVEERTSDGFIVGEYGVVSHDDGSLRGVRYTADGTINPRVIYDALMKFLSL